MSHSSRSMTSSEDASLLQGDKLQLKDPRAEAVSLEVDRGGRERREEWKAKGTDGLIKASGEAL